jgi:uncharacterized cupredoxin-like copper-binding protein
MTAVTGESRGGAGCVPPRSSTGVRPAAVAVFAACGLAGSLAGMLAAAGPPPRARAEALRAVDTPRAIRVEMTEFAFRPAVISLAVGRPVRLVFVNRGLLAHQFQADYLRMVPVRIVDDLATVEAPGAAFVRLEPGTTASLEFYPRRAGRFAFACTIEGHREAGMRGLLEIK